MVMDGSLAPKSHTRTAINVAICDDNRRHSAQLERLLLSYAQRLGWALRVVTFGGGQALLDCGKSFHILFLAAPMSGLDSLETARRLRQRNPDFLLVLVSAQMEYAPMGYEVHAFRFLLKHQLEATLGRCMDAAMDVLGLTRHGIWLPFVGGGHTVYVEEILFVESWKHAAHFHLAAPGRPPHLYQTLDKIAQALPDGEFVRIHQSYLAGLRHVNSVKGYTACLSDGRILPVSQKRFAEVKQAWAIYNGNT